jgi:NitT/TauT family transport system ATP-binding protein
MTMLDVVCRDISHRYQSRGSDVVALDGINIAVERESIFVILGPSGCGKSTLLRIILGLEQPTRGSVEIPADRMDRVAYVPQSAALLPWRTAIQNAALGLEISEGDKEAGKKLQYLKDEFIHYKLKGFEHYPWESLSGGMRQRVALICALASRPEILLCDEPFSAIDFVGRLEMLTHFKRSCLKGVTTIFVTHNIEEAIFLGGKIAVMSRRPGRIKRVYDNELGISAHDSIQCRKDPKFQETFDAIWKDLQ